MKTATRLLLLSLFFIIVDAHAQVKSVLDKLPPEVLISWFTGEHWSSKEPIEIKSAIVDGQKVRIRFDKNAALFPLTNEIISAAADSVCNRLGMRHAQVTFFANKTDLQTLVPQDSWSMPHSTVKPLVRKKDGISTGTMKDFTLALWASHGRYYEQKLNRWEWQRARLFTTVEDLLTSSYVLPFLAPMFENAGAQVLMPRERDMNNFCLVVDDDMPVNGHFHSHHKAVKVVTGFKPYDTLQSSENPFSNGNAHIYNMQTHDTITYTFPSVPNSYAEVYICYAAEAKNSDAVNVQVTDADGISNYVINQQIGGGMWVRLGRHRFDGGKCLVKISGKGHVSADAVRIGGGQGVVARCGQLSGLPRWMECARYYLQSDGFAPIVYNISEGTNDYTDDINCRGEWVNALVKERGINVDMSLAIHTDAGIVQGDSTVGTLAIATTGNKNLLNGLPRIVNRDMAQYIEHQIVADLRASWDSTWGIRGVLDKGYSESRRPEVPAVLMEMLSHQNVNDMRYALHPQFRHDISRSIYKAVLRFYYGEQATVTPLRPSNFGMTRVAADSVCLQWSTTIDQLEPSAEPQYYAIMVNRRLHSTTRDTSIVIYQPNDGHIYDYNIIAVNSGGRSLPSATLSAAFFDNTRHTLVVDGRNALASPFVINTQNWGGVCFDQYAGAPYANDAYSTGSQYNFDPASVWLDDDDPGWGASFSDLEGVARGVAYSPYHIGWVDSLVAQKHNVIAISKDFFDSSANDSISIDSTSTKVDGVIVDLGCSRTSWYGNMPARHSIYTQGFMNSISIYSRMGVNIDIYGDYIGTEVQTLTQKVFAKYIMGIIPRTDHATLMFGRYRSPDAIDAADGAQVISRYPDSGMSAVVKYGNITTYGYSMSME
ncbi:MAG: N-acetylmuramoyl-L-alanine amidase [Bacteroidales bacterium]|nr:N-acetylmuramoyl-L-alanine amidase [Bacteroidales bacterium]